MDKPQGTGRRRRGWEARYRGFSLAEMVVGLQLVVIFGLASLPIASRVLRTYRLRGAAYEVLANLNTARMGAVTKNRPHRVLIVNTNTFQVHDDVNGNGSIDTGEPVMTRDIRTNNPGVQIAAGSSNITFVPNGTAPVFGTITLSSSTAPPRSVTVTWGGRMRIQ